MIVYFITFLHTSTVQGPTQPPNAGTQAPAEVALQAVPHRVQSIEGQSQEPKHMSPINMWR